MKPVLEGRLCFDVVSCNRTYHFQAETETDKEEWMSVLLNSKEVSLNRAFEDNGKTGENQGLVEFQQTLVNYIRNIPRIFLKLFQYTRNYCKPPYIC